MKIVFATNNQHKLSEIRDILGEAIEVLSLKDIGCDVDIPETGTTLEENALQKAQYVYDHYHIDCFADDTGLEVDALNGAPGVYSARYASMASLTSQTSSTSITTPASHDSEANMARLLKELGENNYRKARFRTVIALIQKKDVCPCGCTSIKEVHQFEGIVNGEIIRERRGGEGFGYDPIFQPDGYDKTFAELGMDIKNHISHRARATQKLAEYLLKVKLLLLFAFLPLYGLAQVGTWKNYLSYNHIEQICAAGDDIFVRASNGLYQYNQKDQSITTYDRTNGLSDTNIKLIGWSKQAKRLIAVYQNSNIDLVETNGDIINISSLYSKKMTEDKTVNNVYITGQFAYLSTGFGIVKINMLKAEITETYNLGKNITAVNIRNNSIYAKIDDTNVISAPISSNLIDPNNWTATEEYPSDIFISDQSDWEKYYDVIASLNPGGPKYNTFGFMKFNNDKLITSDNSTSDVVNASIQILKDNEWKSFNTETVYEKIGRTFVNVYAVDVDPLDDTHYFAGARAGLFEFRNGELVKHYNSENSPIESYNGKSLNHQLITGVKYDSSGDLWILNSSAFTKSVIKYTKTGEFVTYDVPELMKLPSEGSTNKSNANMVNIIFDHKGYMWFVNNNWTRPAAYRYDMNNNSCTEYYNFINQDGTAIQITYGVRCICEDKEGNMWLGTDLGPILLEKSQIESDNPVYTQVKIPRNDGTNYADYLLNKVDITAIAVDAGNRKWIGTNGNGVYLISADNLTQLQHFTTDNSKLLSNIVNSITINEKTGEIFFGTDNGLCSYISDATDINTEMTKDNVWAYPNPVTPDYSGLITVVGLTFNADVKIVSSNGALVAEGRSNGGSFTWDGKDKKGNRVASGIYMVVTATSEGKKGTVCKISIIR